MLGKSVRGTQSEPGSILVAQLKIAAGKSDRVMVVPGPMAPERRCVIVMSDGIFLAHDTWLQHDFWDVTEIASIEPDFESMRLERGGSRTGEIAIDADGRLLISYRIDRPFREYGWIARDTGEVVPAEGALVRFSAWKLVVRRGTESVSLLDWWPRAASVEDAA